MPDITITLTDAVYTETVGAFASAYQYEAATVDGLGNSTPNPETTEQFFQRKLVDYLTEIRGSVIISSAVNTARATATAGEKAKGGGGAVIVVK